MIPPRTDRLWTGPAPIDGAAWIPTAELGRWQGELAPREVPVVLVGSDPEAERWLRTGGRTVLPGEPEPFAGPGRLWEPSPLVAEWGTRLEPGRVIDAGCGAGRDAIWLAWHGWQVEAYDHLPEVAAGGAEFAVRAGVGERITWTIADLSSVPSAEVTGGVDWLVSQFAFDRAALPALQAAVRPGGWFTLETYSPAGRRAQGRRLDDSRFPDAKSLAEAFAGWEIERLVESERPTGATLRLAARRPTGR